jgi:dTDP-4-amino-4,6-dideoxygalactose transaminase
MIPCANPAAGVQLRRAAIDAAIRNVLDRGRYILGDEVAAFEREFAAFCGTSEAVGVSSGTDGLVVAMACLGVGPGDEVVTVSHTAVATVSAIVQLGARPVLMDIDPQTFGMDPAELGQAFGPRTRAVIPVHLYGHAVDMDAVMQLADQHRVPVIEDCSQAHGARWRGRRVGTFGRVGVFSCYPTKNLGAIGDAGVVVTSDPVIAQQLREYREYGWRERYNSSTHGMNHRLDELQAAILRVRLRHLDADNQRRRELAAQYSNALRDLPIGLPTVHAKCEAVFHLYVITSLERDRLRTSLAGLGIGCLVHYPFAVHQQQAYAQRVRCVGKLAVTERAAASVLSLPLFPEMTDEQQERVISSLREVFDTSAKIAS